MRQDSTPYFDSLQSVTMNRFEYADSRLMPNEVYVRRDMAVRLYDGDTKVIAQL